MAVDWSKYSLGRPDKNWKPKTMDDHKKRFEEISRRDFSGYHKERGKIAKLVTDPSFDPKYNVPT